MDLDVLQKTTEELLRSRGVFDVDAFGWLSEDDVDPEFVGYAMWVLSPPYTHDFVGFQNDAPPNRAPTEAEQQLMELGHDFFGLMKTARHFIGHALLHQPAVSPLRIEATGFDFNEFAALVALTAASDRLRDFIIMATLGTRTKSPQKQWKELEKAYNKLRVSSLGVEADALKDGFKAIEKARVARNESVHGLATQPAHVQRVLMARDREAFENQRWQAASNREVHHEDFIREQQQLDAEELAKVEARAKLLCDCHVMLIKLGELSFRTELNWRQRQSTTAP